MWKEYGTTYTSVEKLIFQIDVMWRFKHYYLHQKHLNQGTNVAVEWVLLFLHIRQVTISNLVLYTEHPGWDFWWFPLVLPGKICNRISNWVMTHFFNILSSPLPINHPIFTRYIIWNTDIAVQRTWRTVLSKNKRLETRQCNDWLDELAVKEMSAQLLQYFTIHPSDLRLWAGFEECLKDIRS